MEATQKKGLVYVVILTYNHYQDTHECLESVYQLDATAFEVVVVDDRSEDGTGELARAVGRGNARTLRVVAGTELPEGWLGKPWACAQGAEAATGELLLFTDADTIHGPELLGRAVAAVESDAADLVTVTGRQLMGSFWERLVQPQIFLTMIFRFFDVGRDVERDRWRDAIANGQFLLFRRDSYDALGGHAAVKGEVVEDLVWAQIVVREGRRLCVRMAETAFATRMYRSLGELVAGWSKNIVQGGLATMPPRLRPYVAPVSALAGATLWLAPPAGLGAALLGVGGPGLLLWSGVTVGMSALFWMVFTGRMGASPAYGLLYPLGSAVGMYIFLRSWARGRNVEWKGRKYRLKDLSEAP
ncbi:MAG: glycosyltransferase family 2 protein [Longimicrobiales bacterium]|nr:glycosyltransferase family 2 protein [Longimicrobiales bacterium]